MEAERASKTSTSKDIAGRKERSHHVDTQTESRRHSIATIPKRVRLWWRNRSATTSTMIPKGLTPAEAAKYQVLTDVVAARHASGIEPPRIVAITDLAKDYDDLAAMIVLKELHRLGVIRLLGFVANLMPAHRRAQFGRGALNALGLPDIPIAQGTSGFPSEADNKHVLLDHEFAECEDFMDETKEIGLMGDELLVDLCTEAQKTGKKLTLLLISSLEDIYTFSEQHAPLLQAAVSNVVLQGGYHFKDGQLTPDESAANNRYDLKAATKFHKFMQDHHIPSTVYTKVAAFATPLYTDLFESMAETEHPLGRHLRMVQTSQDLAFYKAACMEDPQNRFAPFMDQKWFLKNKTSWYEQNSHDGSLALPEGEEVVKYLTKVVVYDALAALGTSGDDAIQGLKVLSSSSQEPTSIHRVVGFAGPPADTGIESQEMADALSALLKGSLLARKQGLQ